MRRKFLFYILVITLSVSFLPASFVDAATFGERPLSRGDIGDDVATLQQMLSRAGYELGDPLGEFGPKTEQALIQFQKDYNLPVTGTADSVLSKFIQKQQPQVNLLPLQEDSQFAANVMRLSRRFSTLQKGNDLKKNALQKARFVKVRSGDLTVPSKKGYQQYTVKAGDTLPYIAAMFEMDYRDLMELNDLNSSKLLVGQQINVPDSPAQKCYLTVSKGNLRTGPGLTNGVIKQITPSTAMVRLETQKGWSYVLLKSGERGWISSNLLSSKLTDRGDERPGTFSKANESTGHLKGLDLSRWNKVIDWNAIKQSGIDFIYAKITGGGYEKGTGNLTIDPAVEEVIKGALAAGLPIGFYHYSFMGTGNNFSLAEAETEAKFFADTIYAKMSKFAVPGYGDLMPVLDLEEPQPDTPGITGDQIMSWARKFIDSFESYTGRKIMVYTSKYFYDSWGITAENNLLKDAPLWQAEFYEYNAYVQKTDSPHAFGGWKDWTVWQTTGSGTNPGVEGTVDKDWGPKDLDLIMPPSKPTGLTVTDTGSGQASLRWNANKEVDIKGYRIYQNGNFLTRVYTNNYTVTGLKPGRTYEFSVEAIDWYNDVSGVTSPVEFTAARR